MMGSSGTRLSQRERDDIVRLYVQGEKIIVIATVLGCSEGSVQRWVRLMRARGIAMPVRKRGPRGENGTRLQ
jgi:DNA-directed RNA polymerase specialized sigma24 family protein